MKAVSSLIVFVFFVLLTICLTACVTGSGAKQHYVDVNDEDLSSFCVKAQNEYARHLDEGKTEIIKGEVKAGESFEKKISNGLTFRLRAAAEGGWVLGIVRTPEDDPDYISVSTPPFTAANGRFINIDSGKGSAKSAIDWNPRSFCFVLNNDDYVKAHAASQLVVSPFKGGPTIEDQDAAYHGALGVLTEIKYGVGWFSITDSAIHSGESESIDHINFEVEIRTP